MAHRSATNPASLSPALVTPWRNARQSILSLRLRHRSFLVFLTGSVLSNTGNQMRRVAVSWEVFHRTHQAISLGYIGLALALPVILLALPAGAAADRYPRRTLIMIGQAGLAASGIGLAWASWTHASLGWIYFFLVGTAVFRALGWPAASAIVSGLVPPKIFSNAAMWRSVGFQLAATVGPLVGGVLLTWWQPVTVYLIDAASSLLWLGCLPFVRPRAQQRVAEPHTWKSFLQGIRYLRRQPVILSTMVLDMVGVLFGGATALLPIYATSVLARRRDRLRLDGGHALDGGNRHERLAWRRGRRSSAAAGRCSGP